MAGIEALHPLVEQLQFARTEFVRGLEGITDEEARRRFMPMNCMSWNVGHLAWQEQRYWLWRAQDQTVLPELNQSFAYGAAASTPALDEVLSAWSMVTQATNGWLSSVTTETLASPVLHNGELIGTNWGSLLLRMIYHYWYHGGENMAIRQNLGHADLPEFVGEIDTEAPYRPE